MHFHHGLENEDDEAALKSRHGCTDMPCCFLFIAALAAFGYLYIWAIRKGDIGRIYHGIDYQGRICGTDPEVRDQPFLYWCPTSMIQGTLSLNLANPICVARCPGAGEGGPVSSPLYSIEPQCEVVSGPEGVASYRTMTLMERYCIPHPGSDMYDKLAKQVTGQELKSWGQRAMASLSSIPAAWPILLSVFCGSIVMGYVYLALLRHCAEILIWVSMFLLVVTFAGLGFILWRTSGQVTVEDLPAGVPVPVGVQGNEKTTIRTFAGVCWALAAAVICLFFCFRHSIAAASACAEVACDTMFEMPSLLVAPVVKACLKGVVCLVLLYGMLLLASTASISEGIGDGLSRNFEFTPNQYYMLIFYMFMSFWILAFFSAVYQFVLAYATAEYYYTPYDHDDVKDVECCVLFEGLHIGLLYHTGSLAFGSFLIAFLQTVQKIIEYAEHKNEETANSHVVQCLLCACACCVRCCKDVVKFINKNAYIDIAITSHNFCDAAREALTMIIELGGAMTILNGATFVFTVFGATLMSIACGAITYVAAGHGAFADQESAYNISDPLAPMLVSMLVGLLVALDFMNVFDMASDSLLYCYGVDLHNGRAGHSAPMALKELVHSGEHGGDPRRH